jgi:hypothetical protein
MKNYKFIGTFLAGILVSVALFALVSFKSDSSSSNQITEKPEKIMSDGTKIYKVFLDVNYYYVVTNPIGGVVMVKQP